LRQDQDRFISLASSSLPSLNLFAAYSPEYPCLLKGLSDYEPIVSRTFGGLQPGLHITLEVTKDQGSYVPSQAPKYAETRQPYCSGLPTPKIPAQDQKFADGFSNGPGAGGGK